MSSDSVIQFTSFPASEAYIKDDGIVAEGLEKVKAAEGHVRYQKTNNSYLEVKSMYLTYFI